MATDSIKGVYEWYQLILLKEYTSDNNWFY